MSEHSPTYQPPPDAGLDIRHIDRMGPYMRARRDPGGQVRPCQSQRKRRVASGRAGHHDHIRHALKGTATPVFQVPGGDDDNAAGKAAGETINNAAEQGPRVVAHTGEGFRGSEPATGTAAHDDRDIAPCDGDSVSPGHDRRPDERRRRPRPRPRAGRRPAARGHLHRDCRRAPAAPADAPSHAR